MEMRGANRAERIDRARHASGTRTVHGWRRPAPDPEEKRHGIGGNNPPEYDPEAPVTGFPMVLRPMEPVVLDGKEITCRGQERDFCRANGVERTGLEWTGDEKPGWWDEYKDNRRERERAARKGKAKPPRYKHKPTKGQS